MELKSYFASIKKGTIEVINKDVISWILGNLVLDFSDNCNEVICTIYRNAKHKSFHELTHIHIDYSELSDLIKDIDNPNRKICIHKIFFGFIGVSFKVVDITHNKKFMIYSI